MQDIRIYNQMLVCLVFEGLDSGDIKEGRREPPIVALGHLHSHGPCHLMKQHLGGLWHGVILLGQIGNKLGLGWSRKIYCSGNSGSINS